MWGWAGLRGRVRKTECRQFGTLPPIRQHHLSGLCYKHTQTRDDRIHLPPATSHRQHDAELRLAAQHAVVGLAGSFQRVGLDHGNNASQFSEA